MRAPEFWRHDGVLPGLLSPASKIWQWRAVARLRQARPTHLDIPVVCVGNAVVGGAGKTPVAMSVAASLANAGATPHFLSRGYGGTIRKTLLVDPDRHTAREVGDEPLLLSRIAPTWIGSDRAESGRSAAGRGADVLVMDDGFQNHGLYKDLSILVIDGEYGFGNGRILPAGPLRETVESAFSRAHAVVYLGPDNQRILDRIPNHLPTLKVRFAPAIEDDDISGRPVVAFAGIGRPQKFFETLAGMGCDLVETRSFPDHHYFSIDEVMKMIDLAASHDAITVTTEKDFVRLPEEAVAMVRPLRVKLEWRDPEALDRLLKSISDMKA